MSTLTPSFEEFLPAWVAAQRWYRGKSSGAPRLRRIASLRWEDPFGEVGLEDHLVLDESGPEPVVYQVPLSYRAEPVDFMADALVATAEHDELGTRYIYDATHDPVFAQVLLQEMYAEHDVPSARARRIVAGGTAPALRSARVLTGEQSNTSIIVEAHGETRPVIIKVFRVLQPGENPEVAVLSQVGRTGNRLVPGPIGYVEGRWPLPDDTEARGHLAFAQEFLPGTQDAWRTAVEAARADEDFSERARTLGVATATVHAVLRETFPTATPDGAARATLVQQLRARAQAAFAEVPELASHRQEVEDVYAAIEDLELPALQRVHGDYHLGQVLDAPGRGWVLLDFEGEPLRPLEERSAPDLALRDVAGMLRSFDYAGATVSHEGGGERDAWVSSARAAFLEGYASASGEDLDAEERRQLLDALELDKALYEVVYEARNRPAWMPIPVGAVQRLVTGGRAGRHLAADRPAEAVVVAPGRHRAADDVTDAGTEQAPVAADFGVGGVAAHGAGSLEAPDGHIVSEAPPEEYAAPPVRGLRDLDPAVHGPSASDPETRVDDVPDDDAADEPAETDGGVPVTAGGQAVPAAATLESATRPVAARPRDDLADYATAAHPYPPASGGYPHAPVPAPPEMFVALGETEPEDEVAQAAPPARPASGGLPHPPIPAPAEMTQGPRAVAAPADTAGPTPEAAEPMPTVDENEPVPARRQVAASGLAPRPEGWEPQDPQVERDRAWSDAASSPAVVTGEVVTGDGVGGPWVSGRVERVLLDAPEAPPAPHTRPLDLEEATDVVFGLHPDPHSILGAHAHQGHVTVRTVRPEADAVTVVLADGREFAMTPETGGIWVTVVPQPEIPTYRLRVEERGHQRLVDEAYRHRGSLTGEDLRLIAAGRHEELWKALGSHVMTVTDEMGDVVGTRFAVWAPNALAVHVIGDFNDWDGARHALRVHEEAGVWEIFVPDVVAGAHYKYDITGPDGTRRAKADPMARASEVPPFNNSVVTVSSHRWNDHEWLRRRATTDIHHGPMSIYEVHLGSWRQGLSYEQLADELVAYVSDMGFTHVELMPVMQHPYGPSWGYHVTGYYSADSRFGHEDGLRYLIDRLHQADVGVILDWVPGHFATDPWALARFDGTPIYEHPDPRKGWHPEWGSYIFDYGRPEVRNFLVANATYWMEEFHADGLRVDGVASMLYLDYSREHGQWIPNKHGGRENLEAVELLQETNATAYRRNPGIVMIAEESTSWPGVTTDVHKGGLGFGFKWNMGWMHDTLNYLAQNPYSRSKHHHAVTFSLVYAYSEKYILPISHDEVVHGKGSLVRKMSGDTWQKFATTRAFLGYQWSHPGKQLLFMGTEFAQAREWADGGTLQWELTDRWGHAGVQRLVRDLNRLYAEHPALWEIDHHKDGFSWLDANDAGRNLYSYLRWGNESPEGLRPVVAVLVNFSGIAQERVHVGLPYGGRWREVLNTDAEHYDGSGQGNMGHVQAHDYPHQHQPFSALVTVPPMATVWLVPDPEPETPAALTEAGSEADGTMVDGGTGDPEDDGALHPRAGQTAQEQDLVDVEALLAAYTEIVPDPDDVDQQVAFGTSGHRGSSLDGAFNEHHILATTQAICDYRREQGTDGPLFLGRDTHALSEPAWRSALEVLVANGVDVRVDSGDSCTPTPAVSRAILQHNRETEGAVGAADGIVVTPSHNPPRDGGFKYNPPHGGPADTDATGWIADRANELLRAGLDGVRRVPFAEARAGATGYDFTGEYVRALPRVVDVDAIRRAGVRIAADPLGGASVNYWQAVADEHGLDLTVVNPEVDPAWSFMTLDWDGKIRMDCSSPHAMASLIRRMEGGDGDGPGFDVAVGNDADADRHGVVTPDGGLMNPNHYLAVAIDYLYGGARPDWPDGTAIGKTLVSSTMIDKVAEGLGRRLVEVPVGFKWFVPGLLDGSIAFGGEESAGASFLCRDGSVWSTDKDGIILALLAAEIIATTGSSPSERYAELVDRYAPGGEVAYARVDAPADRQQKAKLKNLSAADVTATEIAGEPITAVLTEAPGNGAAIGGVKVTTEHAWFAARPSGTEDVYKIYAESFRGPEHLAQVQAEAQEVVDAALQEG